MSYALEARELSRTIDAPWGRVEAVRSASLCLTRGGSTAVVGASGSGKSTLLNLLGLLDTPTSGQLMIAGQVANDLNERQRTRLRSRHLGFVFQSFHLIPHKDVLHNVVLPLRYVGSGRRVRYERAAHALEDVGLSHRVHSSPLTLSGGEKQRVAVARAAIGQPDVLLCDEPTGNLDGASSELVLDVLLGLAQKRGSAVVIVTHDATVAARCDSTLMMKDGVLGQMAETS